MIKTTLRIATIGAFMLASIGAWAKPSATKPIEITGVFQEQIAPSLRCASTLGGTLAGHGDGGSLGRVAFVATDCITPTGSMFTFSEGRFIIVTTSGDQIFAAYSGQFVPTGEGTKYVFSGGTFQITGGSGEYAKASGGGTITGGEDIATGSGSLKLSGQIHAEGKDSPPAGMSGEWRQPRN